MRLVFCSDSLAPHIPDLMYAQEVTAASSLGIAYSLIDFEVPCGGNEELSLKEHD